VEIAQTDIVAFKHAKIGLVALANHIVNRLPQIGPSGPETVTSAGFLAPLPKKISGSQKNAEAYAMGVLNAKAGKKVTPIPTAKRAAAQCSACKCHGVHCTDHNKGQADKCPYHQCVCILVCKVHSRVGQCACACTQKALAYDNVGSLDIAREYHAPYSQNQAGLYSYGADCVKK
jgi:hypothetical protein